MSNLQDDFFPVSAYFIGDIPAEKRDAASKALDKLIWIEVLPSGGPIEDMQKCEVGGGPVIDASIEEKFLYLMEVFKDDHDMFCRCVLMLIKVYQHLKSNYPEFRFPLNFIDSDYIAHVAEVFGAVSDRLAKKAYQEALKEFFKELVEEWPWGNKNRPHQME